MLAATLVLLMHAQAPTPAAPATAAPAAAAAPAPASAAAPAPAPASAVTTAPASAVKTTPAPPPRPRLLVLETRADAAYVDAVRAFGDLLATLLEQRSDAEVIPSSSVKDRLAVAADKLAAGCDDTACMTEIAGAMDARYVITSRASQVGGRWLMRVELFDSQDLKIIAQATAMADSVEGLAAQAELLADDIVARAPVIGRRPTGTSGTPTDPAPLPPPDARKGGGWMLGTGIGALVGAAVLAGVGIGGYAWAAGDASRTANAIDAYQSDPNVGTRQALIETAQKSDASSNWHLCLFMPLGWACYPVGLTGAGLIGWSMIAGSGETSEESPP